jgi:hypothetical protein
MWQAFADDKTLRTYSHPLISLVQAVLLSLDFHPSGYKFRLTSEAREAAEALLLILKDPEPLDRSVGGLHRLVFHLLATQRREGEGSKWDDVLECFLAILAMKDDGNFSEPKGLTQMFAQFKYHCRSVLLYEAHKRGKAENNAPVQ